MPTIFAIHQNVDIAKEHQVFTGLDICIFERKIVNIFLPVSFEIYLGLQMNCLIETDLLSTHNICFS